MSIKLYTHKDIDKIKWNECIANANNKTMYALSWYLDLISPNWNALILGDYECIMPLTWKTKFNIPYLIQPEFAQQLGVFSTSDKDKVLLFLNEIARKYFYINICINSNCTNIPVKYKIAKRTNFVLHLNESYETLRNNYNRSTKTNLKRANENELLIRDIQLNTGIDFLADQYYALLGAMHKTQKDLYVRILKETEKQGNIDCIGAYYNNELVSVAIAAIVGRHISIQSISSDTGKRIRSLFKLYDFLIHRYSNQDKILDFGGSDIESIAYFFNGFGPKKEQYFQIKYSYFIPKRFL